ncbi:zinc-dependent alcohol dehydrogenase [Phytoactinopolyspora limicola]|uniref:zinc-dependent alcohol dehydrogenase n=1 Tax=Phytoactinopolyspora limicola TaxID=2715536 RepID=UPI00140998D2|nr:alcohol dehydrogenase catalytic domain-containing protein [Phytoactinopolyspora limicola]
MRAFVIEGPSSGSIREVPEPEPGPRDVVVDVEVVGLCGTDVELFEGTMPYFRQGLAAYPLRPGHEWAGTVRAVGSDVTSVGPGDRVTADTFIGCGVCRLCGSGRHYLCADHVEIGVRGGRPGALAELICVPEVAVHRLPAQMSAVAGAFVEPAGCALRAVRAGGVEPDMRTLVLGTGTLGLLAAQFARALGASVCVAGKEPEQIELAWQLGFDDVTRPHLLSGAGFDAVIEATGAPEVPAQAAGWLAPGGRLVLLGVMPEPAPVDVGALVVNDAAVIGVLGGSACLGEAIDLLAAGKVQVEPLVAATVGLNDVGGVLERGGRVAGAGAPKVHVRPQVNPPGTRRAAVRHAS